MEGWDREEVGVEGWDSEEVGVEGWDREEVGVRMRKRRESKNAAGSTQAQQHVTTTVTQAHLTQILFSPLVGTCTG